jgi:hypothetical protein
MGQGVATHSTAARWSLLLLPCLFTAPFAGVPQPPSPALSCSAACLAKPGEAKDADAEGLGTARIYIHLLPSSLMCIASDALPHPPQCSPPRLSIFSVSPPAFVFIPLRPSSPTETNPHHCSLHLLPPCQRINLIPHLSLWSRRAHTQSQRHEQTAPRPVDSELSAAASRRCC